MRVVVVAAPELPVTWEEAKVHLRLDGDDEKVLVEALIAAAAAHIAGPDGWLGRSIGAQMLEARFDLTAVGRQPFMLPFGPVLEITSIQYLNAAGVEQTADKADIVLAGSEVSPRGGLYPWDGGSIEREAGRIQYRAGYDEVPAPIKAAILMMVGDLYRFRTTASDMNVTATAIPMSTTVNALLQPYRVYR